MPLKYSTNHIVVFEKWCYDEDRSPRVGNWLRRYVYEEIMAKAAMAREKLPNALLGRSLTLKLGLGYKAPTLLVQNLKYSLLCILLSTYIRHETNMPYERSRPLLLPDLNPRYV